MHTWWNPLPGFHQCSLLTLLAVQKQTKKTSKKQTEKQPHKSNAKKKDLNITQKLTKNIFKAAWILTAFVSANGYFVQVLSYSYCSCMLFCSYSKLFLNSLRPKILLLTFSNLGVNKRWQTSESFQLRPFSAT